MSGHGFTGGKAQEFLQGRGIASCAGRCRAQSRCPETADHEHAERAARRDGPAARFFGGEWSAELFGKGLKSFLVQELLQPLVQDLPLTLGPLIVRKPQAFLLCLETFQQAGTTAEGTQAVALIDGVTAERLLADRDLTPMRFLSRRQDRGCRRSLCPKAGVQSGVVRTKSLTGPGT